MMASHSPAPRAMARRFGATATAAILVFSLAGIAAAQAQAPAPGAPPAAAPRPAAPAQPAPPRPAAPQAQPAAPRPAQQPAQQQQQPAQQQAAPAQQTPVISTPWTKICNVDPQVNKEVCLITQEILTETGQFLASVAIREVQADPKKTLIIAVPVGMVIQPGLRVIVDNQPPANAKYAVCFPNACYGDMETNAEFINRMKRAQQLTIQTINQAGRTVSFTMALQGFGKAYDGAPIDPKVVEEQRKKFSEEMVKRAEQLRKELAAPGQPGAAPAPAR